MASGYFPITYPKIVKQKGNRLFQTKPERRYLMKRLISLPARPPLIGLLIVFLLMVAACSPSTAAETPSSSVPVTGAETVKIASNPELGQILVTTDGRTLYTNTGDTPEALKCTDSSCTGFWPPYNVDTQPTAGEGLPGSLGTITRPDGSMQVTYNNQPLYTFYQDRQPGEAGGNGFTDSGGTWHVVSLDGSVGGNNGGSNNGYGS
jgi:predicted lipoprotein with Yx(FWY)xxD motif